MQPRAPVRGTPLADQIFEILVERIRDGHYPPETQLPPEHDLANEFDVSRATVRTAISNLSARGMLVKRRGIGTFVSRLSNISNPLNEAMDFHNLITTAGYEAGVKVIHTSIVVPEISVAKDLQIEAGKKVLVAHKVFTANGEPVIYCINSVPMWLLNEDWAADPAQYPGLHEPLYRFLNQHGQLIEYHVANIRAELVSNCKVQGVLPYPPETPMLLIKEVGFNTEERPIFHALEYYPGNQINFELIRRKGPIG